MLKNLSFSHFHLSETQTSGMGKMGGRIIRVCSKSHWRWFVKEIGKPETMRSLTRILEIIRSVVTERISEVQVGFPVLFSSFLKLKWVVREIPDAQDEQQNFVSSIYFTSSPINHDPVVTSSWAYERRIDLQEQRMWLSIKAPPSLCIAVFF